MTIQCTFLFGIASLSFPNFSNKSQNSKIRSSSINKTKVSVSEIKTSRNSLVVDLRKTTYYYMKSRRKIRQDIGKDSDREVEMMKLNRLVTFILSYSSLKKHI